MAPYPGGRILSVDDGRELCRLDVIFPIVHGTSGEDGILQGLLELAGVPYVGAGVAGSDIGMDKVIMRKIFFLSSNSAGSLYYRIAYPGGTEH